MSYKKGYNMTRTKYAGVYYRDNAQKERVFYIQYKNPSGKLIRKKIGTKTEGISPVYCKKLRDQTLVKLRLGEDAPVIGARSEKTLGEVTTEYFEHTNLKTEKKLKSLYNTHLSHLKDHPLSYFNTDTIDKLINKKKQEISKKTKRVLSPQTVKNIIILLSAIMHKAEDKGHIKSIPKFISNKKLPTDNTRERFLSKEEVLTLYDEIEISPLVRKKERLLLFTKLALTTGGRLNSLLSIKGKDINRTSRTFTLKNQKTNHTYTAFIHPAIVELLPPLDPHDRLFDVADAKQIQRPLQRILNQLFNQGLNPEDRKERVVIHSLRHTFASNLAINGTHMKKIMELMDHSDISMTNKYAKLAPDAGREEVENLYG